MPTAAIESAQGKSKARSAPDQWELDSHLHTLRRAGEIVRDKKLMKHIKQHAEKRASEAKSMTHHIAQLAKMGRISPKAMAKIGQS